MSGEQEVGCVEIGEGGIQQNHLVAVAKVDAHVVVQAIALADHLAGGCKHLSGVREHAAGEQKHVLVAGRPSPKSVTMSKPLALSNTNVSLPAPPLSTSSLSPPNSWSSPAPPNRVVPALVAVDQVTPVAAQKLIVP